MTNLEYAQHSLAIQRARTFHVPHSELVWWNTSIKSPAFYAVRWFWENIEAFAKWV